GATDGSHPSDLGMLRYADAYEPVLRSILKQF
ncbi:MAG: SGNH/GDSL hydrolase family protein, partial [Flavobacteriaceae bacterium]